MMGQARTVFAAAILAAALSAPTGAAAADCGALLESLAQHLDQSDFNLVLATVTTNQADRRFASATLGISLSATRVPRKFSFKKGRPPFARPYELVSTDGYQYFSDRSANGPVDPAAHDWTRWQVAGDRPSSGAVDRTALRIIEGPPTTVTLIARNWGDSALTAEAACEGDTMTGFFNGANALTVAFTRTVVR